ASDVDHQAAELGEPRTLPGPDDDHGIGQVEQERTLELAVQPSLAEPEHARFGEPAELLPVDAARALSRVHHLGGCQRPRLGEAAGADDEACDLASALGVARALAVERLVDAREIGRD